MDTRASTTVLADFSHRLIPGTFENWESFFRTLLSERKVVIIDEFQNFLRVDPSVFSLLQKSWDDCHSDVLLVLCGSYSGMMKRLFLDVKQPLFGRSSHILALKPLDFPGAFQMLSSFGYSFEQTVTWYSVLGGVPKYLWYLEPRVGLQQGLEKLFFSDFAPLQEEGKSLLVGEFGSEHPGYFSVLQATGDKERLASEITDRAFMDRTRVMKYIHELVQHYGIMYPVENLLSKRKRGKRYKIHDPFLGFWFRYVFSQQSSVEFHPPVALRYCLQNLPSTVGMRFENIVVSMLPRLYEAGLLPLLPDRVGKNWGVVPGTKNQPYEIDILGETTSEVLVMECKWQNRPVKPSVGQALVQKGEYLQDPRKKVYAIASKSGFAPGMDERIIKVGIQEMEKALQP